MRSSKRYVTELTGAFMLYGVLLVSSNAIQRSLALTGAAAGAVSLLPVLGCVAALMAVMRGIRQMDELGRLVHFEAIAFAFAATALLSLSWGFVEDDGFPRLRAFMVWPMMAALWLIGLGIASRRYR